MRRFFRKLRDLIYLKHSSFDTKVLFSLLQQNVINLLDIGAAGGIEPRWKKISGSINYFGFEPDERARVINPKTRFLGYHLSPFAVGDSDSHAMLNVTKDEGKSSFFFPNQDFLERFPNPSRFGISRQIELQVKRIDSQNLEDIDFMKLDIQGGELSALKGAGGYSRRYWAWR
jgi:FkbM family methyltransferase